ncbi:similar to Saccharomyces cerevisiae YPR036W VMA13 Subunit H of the eight-subunit V1 peripheral membrane domain of the vacuolar H+-ATPase (V-ATPase) [Maudiozyma saulgeensis]|uniref:V-type proton ATPase subunit H n=1 Tax=Maudiozyma saulgeensis TaxID=1789683 RepID=A0A1X7QXR7_9SACH|nr:similar to Saccharomyces cerevisiae YPR036W VMA13 Subunit H of the eight-subunit V1 peripheral membrane domain of the vacuolar H+-ATPase (V-ATPase) [Kazachstania saulgeensis]
MTTESRRILLDSTHFTEIRNAIRSRSVAWDALARASEISEIDAAVAKKLENLIVKNNGTEHDLETLKINENVILPLLHLLATSSNTDSIKSVLNLISELLSCDVTHIANDTVEFFKKNPDQLKNLFDVSFIESYDQQTILISSFNIVSLLVQFSSKANEKMVKQLLDNQKFISILQNVNEMETCYVTIRELQELSTIPEYRQLIWKHEDQILPTIFQIIRRSINNKNNLPYDHNSNHDGNDNVVIVNTNTNNLGIQLQYYSLMLIWLLTFNNQIASEITIRYLNEFLNLLKLIKVTIKEKVTRVSISILLQCCSRPVKGHKTFIKNLILLGNGITTLDSLTGRKYSDEELREGIINLKSILDEEYNELTSIDEYTAELNSKLICWSPPHIDNGFWSDNIDEFKKDDWKLFKQLISLLIEFKEKNTDKVIIQILLNDITHVIDYLPESVDILNKMNGKVIIMELLNNSDSRVKYEALKATQSLIGYKFK